MTIKGSIKQGYLSYESSVIIGQTRALFTTFCVDAQFAPPHPIQLGLTNRQGKFFFSKYE